MSHTHTHTHLTAFRRFYAQNPKISNVHKNPHPHPNRRFLGNILLIHISGTNGTIYPYSRYNEHHTNPERIIPSSSSSGEPRASPTASVANSPVVDRIGVVDRRRTSTLQHTHAACFTGVRARRSRELHAHAHSTSALSANDRSIARDRVTPRNRIFNRFAFRVVVVDRRRR